MKSLALLPIIGTKLEGKPAPEKQEAFQYTVGIVGHPTTPDVRWTDDQLRAIKDVGFNTLQLSIAWASKPADEVLNLEDLDDPAHAAEYHRRMVKAKAFGFRTLAHFGLPVGPGTDATTCILDPSVRANYAGRLERFFKNFNDVDDVMIYTYDQHAWLCSEFGDCPRCHGIPLHERLPGFLEAMVAGVQSGKPGARLWWEPWELSAGQTYAIVERIRPEHFGLIVHNTIAEVQFVNLADRWVRNLARLAQGRGIPLIGEGFFGGSGEDVHPLTHLPCPRLVYQEMDSLRRSEGVVGMKEYYGLVPADFSVNIALVKAYLNSPDAAYQDLITPVAAQYGGSAQQSLLSAWELTARAMEFFPWDASWALRRIFSSSPTQIWRAVPRASWMSPGWQANRRGFYMVTDAKEQHPWLREDVGLRALTATKSFEQAVGLLKDAQVGVAGGKDDLQKQQDDVALAARISKHFGEQLLQWLPDREQTWGM
jgi:hypothetical protein